jgi:hypothetical protein
MQNTFFECAALLKFLMAQKKQCQCWNIWRDPIWLSQSSSRDKFPGLKIQMFILHCYKFPGLASIYLTLSWYIPRSWNTSTNVYITLLWIPRSYKHYQYEFLGLTNVCLALSL